MAQYFFDSQDDFHYDKSGYYGYIVFNGEERALKGLLRALGQGQQDHGLGWYRYGKSFRPANDGNMYDWYVRLHSGGHDKPAAKAVDEFLRRFLKPPQPTARRTVQTPETQKLVQDLMLEALEQYQKSIESLELGFVELRSEMQAGTAAQVELKDVVEQGVANQAALSDAQQRLEETTQELETTGLKLTELEQKNCDLQARLDSKSPTAADSYREENRTLSKALEKAKETHKREIRAMNKNLRDIERERDNWKTQFNEVSEENGRLQEKLTPQPKPETELRPVRTPDVNLESVIGAIMPELRLVESSWDHLKFGDLNHEPVLRRLRSIVRDQQVPGGKAVQGADNWMELHIDRQHWRLYYCRKDSLVGDKIVAMIGKKSEQNQDMQWLRANPPDSCL